MFASKTPRDLNHDPLPYLYASTDYTARFSHNNLGYPYASSAIYDPRPEFDHVQHNEPNPILTWFRAVIEDPKCGEFDQVVDDFLIYHIKGHGKQEHHARKVLTRLANITKEN